MVLVGPGCSEGRLRDLVGSAGRSENHFESGALDFEGCNSEDVMSTVVRLGSALSVCDCILGCSLWVGASSRKLEAADSG